MQISGMLYGVRLLTFAGFPGPEVLGPDASEEAIKALIDRCGEIFVKPVFKGGVGKKGKAGLLGRAKDLKTALKEKERLYNLVLGRYRGLERDAVRLGVALRVLDEVQALLFLERGLEVARARRGPPCPSCRRRS